MIPSSRHAPYPTHRAFAAATLPAAAGVSVAPSRPEIRRADPSLSLRVTAPGARGFDVIVATDPTLFDPANAHRRTPKNFRSSRQDFGGEPIEIETGFYLLPRAFLRDLVSVEPRPTRLYYVAVAYDDAEGRQPRYSIPPTGMAAAPWVGIAADLAAANLSRMLGVAVDRLGALNARGRVMAVSPDPRATHLPEAIGGLPLTLRTRTEAAAAGYPSAPSRQPPGPQAPWRTSPLAPYHAGGAAEAPVGPARASTPETAPTVPSTYPPARRGWPEPQPAPGGFVDEDWAYGAPGGAALPGYRDLDARHGAAAFAYDDGFGETPAPPGTAPGQTPAPADATHPGTGRGGPIPPLDPGPDPAPVAPSAPVAPVAREPGSVPRAGAPVGGTPAPADATAEDQLLQALLAEGLAGRYEALSLDGGFRGRFGPQDPYYRRAHDGLRLGPHQAMQDSGELGELLALMQAADPAGFAQTFGPAAAEMLAMITADGPSGLTVEGGRGPRVQPVAGADLWDDPWVDRFRSAARAPAFQAAMRGQILARRLDPVRPLLAACGLSSARGMAMLLAAAILAGVDGATRLLRAAVNPFDTPARLGAALDALGFADLGSFRAARQVPAGDTIDDATHIALIAALRQLGADSPVQVPDAEAIMDALVTTAGPGALGDALLKIRMSDTFASPGAGA